MRFLGLGLADTVPDANTIWGFREALTRARIAGRRVIEVWVFLRRRTQKPWEANRNPHYSEVDEWLHHEPRTIRFNGIKQTVDHRNE
jgi:hypothetical protein